MNPSIESDNRYREIVIGNGGVASRLGYMHIPPSHRPSHYIYYIGHLLSKIYIKPLAVVIELLVLLVLDLLLILNKTKNEQNRKRENKTLRI